MQQFYGSIRFDTNNSAKLEGLIQGFQIVVRNGWFPVIIEGDSNILIQMAKELANGKSSEKFSSS